MPWCIENLNGKRAFNTVVEKEVTTCVQWLVKHRSMHVFDYDRAFLIAVNNGRLGAVQLLHGPVASLDFTEQALKDKPLSSMSETVESGQLSLVEWFTNHSMQYCGSRELEFAVLSGSLEMVGMIRYNYHAFCTKVAMDFADEFNYLDILNFLHEHRCEGYTARAFCVAIHLG